MAPHTLVAHYESIDPAAAFVNLAALDDDHIFTVGDDLRVPILTNLVAVAAGVASGGSGLARVESPSLRKKSRLHIQPVNGNADADAEPDDPPAIADLRRTPIVFDFDEILQAFTDSNPTAAAAQWVLYWLADGPISPVTGDMFTVRFTDTATLAADAWTASDFILSDTLPVGRYAIVGMRAQSAGLVAARLIFRGGEWRPGVIGADTDAQKDHPMFRYGQFGVFGEFDSRVPPRVEYISISADTAEEGQLDLMRVA